VTNLERDAAVGVYDLLAAGVRGEVAPHEGIERARAATPELWDRAIALEGCGPWVERMRRASPALTAALAPADRILRAHGEEAVRHALVAVWQVGEIAAVAAEAGIRVLALKGVARLLAGETPGWRALSDIDLLVDAGDAPRLHAALISSCGYVVDHAPISGRHLPMLVRAGSLPVEVHTRLSDAGSDLDRTIGDGSLEVPVGNATIGIPSPTARVLHMLEHALVVHRTLRYRLRDITDASTVWHADGVDVDAVRRWVGSRRYARAARTLLAAAGIGGERTAAATDAERARAAWATARRVAVARLAVPARADLRAVQDPQVFIAGQLAEGSPQVLAGLAWRAITQPAKAASAIGGLLRPDRRGRA